MMEPTAMDRTAPWTETLREAVDLGLIGLAVVLAALPLVTIGAALSAGSAAIHERCTGGAAGWRAFARRFGQGLLPGIPVTIVCAMTVVLAMVDLSALLSGRVPGGPAVGAVTGIAFVLLLGLGALTVAEVGRQGGRGWFRAGRAAARIVRTRPALLGAVSMVALLAGALGLIMPPTLPLVVGYGLFAIHVVRARLHPDQPAVLHGLA